MASKRSFFQSFRFKIILPMAISLALLMTGAYFTISYLLERREENEVWAVMNEHIENVYQDIDRLSRRAIGIAVPLTDLAGLERAYQNPNESQGRAQLRQSFRDQMTKMKKYKIAKEIRIHFHKPPARSFLRTWIKAGSPREGGDDLSSFRNSILQVYKTRTSVTGIEMGRGGPVIRGIMPIERGDIYLGSLEMYFKITQLNNFLSQNENIFTYLTADSVKIIDKKISGDKNTRKIGSFLLIGSSNEEHCYGATEQFLQKSLTEKQFGRFGNILFAGFPLKDFSGKVIAATVLSLDISSNIAELNHLKLLFILFFVIMFIIANVLVIFVAHNSSRPLEFSKNAIRDIAQGEGDLSKRLDVKSQDEFGELAAWTNAFIEHLAQIIRKIKESVVKTTETVDAINSFFQVLSDSIQNQSSSAEESSAAIEEISSSMSTVLETIKQQSRNADENKSDIQKLNEMGKDIERAMEVLNSLALESTEKAKTSSQSVNQATGAMSNIRESTQQINQVVSVITDISDQTSLLSLNAAIEAARAGDSGRGFAVVADEISKLADRTVTGVKEITDLINKVNSAVNDGTGKVNSISGEMLAIIESINKMQEQISGVKNSVGLQTDMSHKIRDRASQVNQMAMEIDNAISEQRISIEEMNKAMLSMAQDAAEISEKTHDLNVRIDDLSHVSASLRDLVDRFKLS